jgi:hypothetical protein
MLAALWSASAAMQWFDKAKRREVWEEPIEDSIGDIGAAQRIREICRAAADSAEKVGAAADRNHKKVKGDAERYERAAKTAMEIAMKISDELLRDAAVREIVELCLRAGNVTTAHTLLRAIQAKSIRDEVLREHPQLQQ